MYSPQTRIREASYHLLQYTSPPSSSIEFDPPCSLFDPRQSGLSVIELGSGTGFTSFHLAKQLSDRYSRCDSQILDLRRRCIVVATDLEEVCPLLQKNWATICHTVTPEDVDLLIQPLAWGNATHVATVQHELESRIFKREPKPSVLNTHIIICDLVCGL